jgi:putative hydrolase of the HAD superfamily
VSSGGASSDGRVRPLAVRAVISDFGGVLTNRLVEAFMAFQRESGISMEQLGQAMQRVGERDGEYPLFPLERGELTEAAFLANLAWALEVELGRPPELHRFREIYFRALHPNQPMLELMRELRERGYRMALLTNNVREWEPLWRAKLPVDEIFEVVVDSAFVGMRKPDPEIYRLTLERLGGFEAGECLFIDDNEGNVEAARSLGMLGVRFQHNAQAIPEIRSTLAVGERGKPPVSS